MPPIPLLELRLLAAAAISFAITMTASMLAPTISLSSGESSGNAVAAGVTAFRSRALSVSRGIVHFQVDQSARTCIRYNRVGKTDTNWPPLLVAACAAGRSPSISPAPDRRHVDAVAG